MRKKAPKAEVPPFERYSDDEWRAIEAVLPRGALCTDTDSDYGPDYVSFRDKYKLTDMGGLKSALEVLGRNVVLYSKMPLDPLRFFCARANQAVELRRQLVDTGLLPPDQRQRVAKAVDEIEHVCTTLVVKLVEHNPFRVPYEKQRTQNAGLPELDLYFVYLINVWMCIGGKLGRGRTGNTKATREFIAACARPVVGKSTASVDAVSGRLKRLKFGEPDDLLAIPVTVFHRWELALQLSGPSRGRTKPD